MNYQQLQNHHWLYSEGFAVSETSVVERRWRDSSVAAQWWGKSWGTRMHPGEDCGCAAKWHANSLIYHMGAPLFWACSRRIRTRGGSATTLPFIFGESPAGRAFKIPLSVPGCCAVLWNRAACSL